MYRFPVMLAYGLAVILMAACTSTTAGQPQTPAVEVHPSETVMPAGATPTFTRIPTLIPPTDTPGSTPTPGPSLIPRPTRTPTGTPTPTHTPRPPLGAGPFRAVVPVDEAIPGTIEGLHATPDGRVWVYSDQAVAWLQADDTWSIFLPEYAGEFAGIDDLGRVWVADYDLAWIAAWDGQAWTWYVEESGWVPPEIEWYRSSIQSWVYVDAHGWLWLATVGDVRAFDGHRWHIFGSEEMGMEPPEYDQANYVLQIYEDLTWVGECEIFGAGPGPGHGVRWYDGEWHGGSSPLATGCVTTISVDPAGQIWLGMIDALWQTDPHGEQWKSITMPDEALGPWNFGFPISLTLGPSGDVWATYNMCSAAGCEWFLNFYHIEGGVWTLIAEFGSHYPPSQLLLGADGTPWLFSIEGIDRVIDNVREPVSSLIPRFVAQDPTGQMWFIAEQDGQNWLWTLDESG